MMTGGMGRWGSFSTRLLLLFDTICFFEVGSYRRVEFVQEGCFFYQTTFFICDELFNLRRALFSACISSRLASILRECSSYN